MLQPLNKNKHALHFLRCISGLSGQYVEADTSRMTLAYYCISGLDILDVLETKVTGVEREEWRNWIWRQQISGPHGTGFRPGPSTTIQASAAQGTHSPASEFDQPHLINTYTALVSLAILRDDFSKLDRKGLIAFLQATQQADGSFSPIPEWGETDVRLIYCAFIISSLLEDWSGVDVSSAIGFVQKCRTWEGGYGQCPGQEANGGPTYCAVACLILANVQLPESQREQTIRWLLQRQIGGFQGRTNKDEDACYSFWCGAALRIMGSGDFVDADTNSAFLSECQFKFGGIGKAPGEHPDPFHTYMALACTSLYPPSSDTRKEDPSSWDVDEMDPLVNARTSSAKWAKEKIPLKE